MKIIKYFIDICFWPKVSCEVPLGKSKKVLGIVGNLEGKSENRFRKFENLKINLALVVRVMPEENNL